MSRRFGRSRRQETATEPLAPEASRPTAPPGSEGHHDQPTRDEPFAGSPAKRWADGAAAIELPEAEEVNGISVDLMAEALELTRDFLIGTNLDPAVLAGQIPDDALALLDPASTDVQDVILRALEEPSQECGAACG
jgi:hypothetical protein